MTTPDDAAALARRHERHLETDQQDALAASGTLSHLPVPVSIIWGEKDKYLGPSLAAEIAALFPNPSVHLLPGAGHYPQHDQPGTVAELLKEPQTALTATHASNGARP